ncbi:MAG: glycosyltransferase [Desulfobulbaceae bacterium]|nr:MAG: glycosyltransferase [Desulfobulbaceae bacterium]
MELVTKADLHVHSKHSRHPSQWVLRKVGCAESYTEPRHIYHTLRDKGMSLITITDHDTLEGSLEIAHLPDTFISEEITACFPEDRCKVHVLAYDITEAQHLDIQKCRENVFELVAYLDQSKICHALAHPLFSVNGRLTKVHFEQLLLLFKVFEINGTWGEHLNSNLRAILDLLEPADLRHLEDKHSRPALHPEPWHKTLIGGSDDHSSLNIARTHTVMPGKRTLATFLQGIHDGETQPVGRESTPKTMGHNFYSIAYQFYKQKFQLAKQVNKDVLLKFIDRNLDPVIDKESGFLNSMHALWSKRLRPGRRWPRTPKNSPQQLQELLHYETTRLIRNDPQLMEILSSSGNGSEGEGRGKAWFAFVNQSANMVLKHSADHLLHKLSQGRIFDIFHSLGSAGALYTLLMPYFVSYSMFARTQKFSREVLESFASDKGKNDSGKGKKQLRDATGLRVAHFTDTYHEINGVALTLQQQVALALSTDKDMTIITCDPRAAQSSPGVMNFQPIGMFELPEYPEMKLFYPPLLEMMHFCFNREITNIHSATPGPLGLAALAIAKLIHLPIYGTYHTSLPQYTQYLTQDFAMEELMWKFMLWYYNQMDLVFAPSHSTANELIAKGLSPQKVRVYPRGIDIQRFHPSKRNGFYEKGYQLVDEIKLLYVGRISKEKNLKILEQTFTALHREQPQMSLIIVGDGPYRAEMEQNMAGAPVIFTGYLQGEDLAHAYASADIFIFPSTTDTFGNVVLEAQASGLPVVVSAEGGPRENLMHGQTGLIVPTTTPEAFKNAVLAIVGTPGLRQKMQTQARQYMEDRSFDKSFDQVWAHYEQAV